MSNFELRRPIDANPVAAAFLDGAKYWEFHQTGATMWGSDQEIVATEALKRYKKVIKRYRITARLYYSRT